MSRAYTPIKHIANTMPNKNYIILRVDGQQQIFDIHVLVMYYVNTPQ